MVFRLASHKLTVAWWRSEELSRPAPTCLSRRLPNAARQAPPRPRPASSFQLPSFAESDSCTAVFRVLFIFFVASFRHRYVDSYWDERSGAPRQDHRAGRKGSGLEGWWASGQINAFDPKTFYFFLLFIPR